MVPTFRVTTYELTGTAFSGTTYDLELQQDLQPNYFVMVRGSVADGQASPNDTGVRVIQDAFGTGDLGTSSGTDVIRLERVSPSNGAWEGTITVVECLNDASASGFTLVDVKTVSFAEATSGDEQTTSVNCASWGNASQVAVYGGPSTPAGPRRRPRRGGGRRPRTSPSR